MSIGNPQSRHRDLTQPSMKILKTPVRFCQLGQLLALAKQRLTVIPPAAISQLENGKLELTRKYCGFKCTSSRPPNRWLLGPPSHNLLGLSQVIDAGIPTRLPCISERHAARTRMEIAHGARRGVGIPLGIAQQNAVEVDIRLEWLGDKTHVA